MEKHLRCCVGKFTYARGSATVLHFMELKDFLIEDSLEFSYLFLLRALRRTRDARLTEDRTLSQWSEGVAAKLLSELACELLLAHRGTVADGHAITEFYPGAGLIFEYLKLLTERSSEATGRRVPLRYRAIGPEAQRMKFEVLHGGDRHSFSYMSDEMVDAQLIDLVGPKSDSQLVILNGNQAGRNGEIPSIGLGVVLDAVRRPAVLMLRATDQSTDQERTTIKGHSVVIPSVGNTLHKCRSTSEPWYFKFIPGFDSAYFLPEGNATTGLLLAYGGRRVPAIQGFERA